MASLEDNIAGSAGSLSAVFQFSLQDNARSWPDLRLPERTSSATAAVPVHSQARPDLPARQSADDLFELTH